MTFTADPDSTHISAVAASQSHAQEWGPMFTQLALQLPALVIPAYRTSGWRNLQPFVTWCLRTASRR